MKVICIDKDAWPEDTEFDTEDDFLVNDKEYEVVDVRLDDGYVFYILSDNLKCMYWQECFETIPK